MKEEVIKRLREEKNMDDLFVPLQGSEKQIIWAEKIRREWLKASIEDIQDEIENPNLHVYDSIDDIIDDDEMIDAIIEILSERDAGLIIDIQQSK
jgi:hypothetical protein